MNNRMKKIDAEMTRVIAEIIPKVKDPRCTEMVSVMKSEVSGDLKHAKILLSIFSTDEAKKRATFKAIENAASFIRYEVGKNMKLRCVPELHFALDDSMDYSAKISRIIDSLKIEKEEETSEGSSEDRQ